MFSLVEPLVTRDASGSTFFICSARSSHGDLGPWPPRRVVLVTVGACLPTLPDDLDLDLRWWAAANYLTVGQIYLRENALLREPLTLEHVKPRLLGHWGTSPGLSMLYALLNRVIRETDSDWLYVTGPGHGGPALVAAGWLEGTYSEIYPHVGDDEAGVRTLFRQFSSPGGDPQPRQRADAGQHPRGRRARATRWCTPPARPSTTRTSRWRAWSATARPRPVRCRRRGGCRRS